MKKTILMILSIVLSIVVLSTLFTFIFESWMNRTNSDLSEKSAYHKLLNSYLELQTELNFIRTSLDEIPYLSTSVKGDIVRSISEASIEFGLPPGLLHAIFQIESDYKFWIDHPKVTLTIRNKSVTTQAQGLGGIIWVFWRDSLQFHNIAETSSDLYQIRPSVRGTAFIVRTILNSEIRNGRTDQLIRRIITRYYGSQSHDYEQKMKEVTSNLWLRRIARQLKEQLHDKYRLSSQDSINQSKIYMNDR